jgi:pyrroloquinoline quinone (PQQ) biosynthesis protein C
VRFLAMEGGPDAGFDDLVAACQVGLHGSAKLELAQNYWDEMGNGSPDRVHTVLHDRLVAAIDMPRLSRDELPVEALERTALGGLLATNRWLQPEMIGALGMIELQAGPRCRKVVQGFDRLGAPAAAYPFYTEHAEVDPRHGKDWVEKAVVPLVAQQPSWQQRILRGAWWRLELSLRFFAAAEELLLREASHAA